MILSSIMAQQYYAPPPTTLATFALPNAFCALVESNMRGNYTGAIGSVGASFSSANILEPTYLEADLVSTATSALAGLQFYNGTQTSAVDYAPFGQWYAEPGMTIAMSPSWQLVYYGNYETTGQVNTTLLADLGYAESMATVAQVAVRPNGRIWVWSADANSGAGGWYGGGDPAADTTPSIILAGSSPVRVGAGTSGPPAYCRLRNPSVYTPGRAPAGFRSGVAG